MTGAGRGHRPVCPQGKRERAGPGAAGWRHAEQPRCWAGRGGGVTGDRTGSAAPRCPWKPRSRRCVEPQAERPRACATPPVGDVPGPSTVLFAGRRGQCRAAPAEPQRPGRLRRVFTEDAGPRAPSAASARTPARQPVCPGAPEAQSGCPWCPRRQRLSRGQAQRDWLRAPHPWDVGHPDMFIGCSQRSAVCQAAPAPIRPGHATCPGDSMVMWGHGPWCLGSTASRTVPRSWAVLLGTCRMRGLTRRRLRPSGLNDSPSCRLVGARTRVAPASAACTRGAHATSHPHVPASHACCP